MSLIENGQVRAAVVAEALTWLDTPYHHHAQIKGVGVDCAQILLAVYAGLIPELDPGLYPPDWHLHRSEERYIEWMQAAGAVQTFGPVVVNGQTVGHLVARGPLPGDVALFQFGRCFSHAGIVLDSDRVVHAYLNRKVEIAAFHEAPLDTRPCQIWSLWP